MAGTVVITQSREGRIGRIRAVCTADAADGSFPATPLPSFSGRILALRTNPGATAPQANYDIALTDGDGVDRLQGLGANRHTANSEQVAVVYTGTAIHPPVVWEDALSLAVTGNNVNSAGTVIDIVYEA
jgi:hypothetical protein